MNGDIEKVIAECVQPGEMIVDGEGKKNEESRGIVGQQATDIGDILYRLVYLDMWNVVEEERIIEDTVVAERYRSDDDKSLGEKERFFQFPVLLIILKNIVTFNP